MAHIVAASTGGPRDIPILKLSDADRAHHSNIAVLCANCHKTVDKAPNDYPIEMIKRWKSRHQTKLKEALGTPEVETRQEAFEYIEPLLAQNHAIYDLYAPQEENFSDSRANLWRRHVINTIVPNNATLARFLRRNRRILNQTEREAVDKFLVHIAEFEARHVLGDWSAGTTRFPEEINNLFRSEK